MEQAIWLPQPQTTGGKPLMDCLRERHSTREYSRREVPVQELSNLLWAAFGLTREHAGVGIGRPGSHTAPTACNYQLIDIYVARADGVYLYEPHGHELRGVLPTTSVRLSTSPSRRSCSTRRSTWSTWPT